MPDQPPDDTLPKSKHSAPWWKMLVGIHDHPKVVQAGPCASWLWLASISWSNAHLTDGVVPEVVARRLVDWSGEHMGFEEAAERLLRVKLWERPGDGHGYLVHDFLDYSRSRKQITRLGRIRAHAGRLGGQAPHRQAVDLPDETPQQVATTLLKQNGSSSVSVSVAAPVVVVGEEEVQEEERILSARQNGGPPDRPIGQAPAHGDSPELLENHARLWRAYSKGGEYQPLPDDLKKLGKAMKLYGYEKLLDLQAQFFQSVEGWWVERGAYRVGAFVKALNDLTGQTIAQNRPHLTKRMSGNLKAVEGFLRKGAAQRALK